MLAIGTFDVNLQPLTPYTTGEAGTSLSRMSIDKTFQGDLVANSIGEMLTAMTAVEGSAGYVAIEQVTGRLNGKQGSFVFQHHGVMNATGQQLILEVLPDSGTGELTNLTGKMVIRNVDGQHSYEFDYSFL
ncbi:MAG: hypothetical protein DHS20C20_20740 [Ardenticatenaceae bacterium]|nr:MAG: hypothetical protein DHS20C20_20740 [Ardenticatenaceae bacterium]